MPSRALHSSRSCAATASPRLASAPAASSASRSLTCLRSSLSSARAPLSLATAARSFCSAASAAAALSSAAASALSRSSEVFSRSSHPPRSSRICSTCWHSSVRSAASAVRASISACSDERAAACGSRTRIHQSTRLHVRTSIAAARRVASVANMSNPLRCQLSLQDLVLRLRLAQRFVQLCALFANRSTCRPGARRPCLAAAVEG